MQQYLPNFLTLLNLISGSVGTILALKGYLTYAAFCIWLGAFFDFFDGLVARLLKAYSPLGQQLDSLADLVTFGCLPASIIYELLSAQTASCYLPFMALFITCCAALRLARFNIDTKQNHEFTGLPVPAHGLFISTLPWIITADEYAWLTSFLTQPHTLIGLVILTSYLLIAPIQLMAFKFATYAWYPNRYKYGFLLTATLLVLLLRAEGLALSIVLYVLVSITSRLKKTNSAS